MNAADITAPVCRLDHLSRGLALDISTVGKADDPMLYLERQAYLGGLRKTLAGLESARVAPVKARQRIEGREAAARPLGVH